MKKLMIVLLAFLAVACLATPLWADDGSLPNTVEFLYEPLTVSSGIGFPNQFAASNIQTLQLRFESPFGFGNHNYSFGTKGAFTVGQGNGILGGAPVIDVTYNDVELYGKINFRAFGSKSEELSPFHLYVGYKTFDLAGLTTAPTPANGARTSFINGNGFGGGLGFDGPLNFHHDRSSCIGLNALVAYYPSMSNNGLGTLSSLVYRANFRTRIDTRTRGVLSGVLGFEGESQSFNVGTVNYAGVTVGLDFRY